MRHNIKYLAVILMLAVCMIFSLAGCGQEEVIPVTEPTLEVTKEGELIAYLVESFDKDYYSLEELDAMVREEIAAYGAESEAPAVAVESVAMAADGSKQVVVTLRFADSIAYADYFDLEAFYGTVEQAMAQGYVLSAALTGVKDGELLTEEEAVKNKKRHILIIEDQVMVRSSGKVLYVGTNASMTEEGFVDCTQSEGLKLIIMK